jgi:hypothetical protein
MSQSSQGKSKKPAEPFEFAHTVMWWKCGAPKCWRYHVDEKRARSCPERKRAIRAAYQQNTGETK